jgi:phosphoglycerate dehydrogenase-like enzyme
MKILLMYEPGAEHLTRLQRAAPMAEFVVAHNEEEACVLVVDADAVLGNRWFYQTVDAANRLQWMQSNSMGVDLILERAGHRDFILTCARGIYDAEVAQHAVALALALVRGLPAFRDAQHREEWNRRRLRDIGDMDALILGSGGVGRSIASMLEPFGTRVQSGRSDGRYSFDVELLFLALPLTARTRHLVGRAQLNELRPGALVVNVGRGETLDTDALLAATHLGGAALDVFESEPLPADHAVWRRRDILITPHVARSIEDPPYRWEKLFEENVRRFAAGEPLLHVVNREKGY